MPSKPNLYPKSPFTKGEDVILAMRILYDYHKAVKVRDLKSGEELDKLRPRIRSDLRYMALPMVDVHIEVRKGVEDLPDAVDVLCRTTAGSVLEGATRAACMKLWSQDLEVLSVAAIVIYELPAGSTHIHAGSHQICYRYSHKDALAKVLRIVDTPPPSDVALPESPLSPLASPVSGTSHQDIPPTRRRRRSPPPRVRRPLSPSPNRERRRSPPPIRERYQSPLPAHYSGRASSSQRDLHQTPPPSDDHGRPNQEQYIALLKDRDRLASRARKLTENAEYTRKRERALKDEVDGLKDASDDAEHQARLERELDMAVDIQAAGMKLRRAEQNLQSVLQRLVALDNGAKESTDVLDALACVEASVRDLEAEVEIATAARMAAEGRLQEESKRYKDMLEAIEQEYREPFVVPALVKAFAKVARINVM